MATRHRQLGYVHIIAAIVLLLGAIDMIASTVRAFRAFGRRSTLDRTGQVVLESSWARFRRVGRSLLPHFLVVAILIAGVWAIARFGPLRPIHEW